MELHNDTLIVGNGPETRTLNNPANFHAVYGGKKTKRKTRKQRKHKGGSTPTSSSIRKINDMNPIEFMNSSLESSLPANFNREKIHRMLSKEKTDIYSYLNTKTLSELEEERKKIRNIISKITKMKKEQNQIMNLAHKQGNKLAVSGMQSMIDHTNSLGLEHSKNIEFHTDILKYIEKRMKELSTETKSLTLAKQADDAMRELLAEEATRKKTPPSSSTTKKKKPKSKKK